MKEVELYITDINALTNDIDNPHFGEDKKQHIALFTFC